MCAELQRTWRSKLAGPPAAMLYLVPIVLLRSESRQRGASFAPITPDMQLAIERRPGHAGAMAKKRKWQRISRPVHSTALPPVLCFILPERPPACRGALK